MLLLLAVPAAAQPLTFDEALARAMKARGVDDAFAAGIARLETPPGPTLPALRAEAAAQTAQNIDLVTEDLVRFDALTMILSVDYPLFTGDATGRSYASARASALLFRRRALDEAEDVFRDTLETFTQLYVAQQRVELLNEGVRHASQLRDRAKVMLDLGEITNVVAANWEEQALATESQYLDFGMQRLEAETRLKQLLGDTSGAPLEAVLDFESTVPPVQLASLDALVEHDPIVDRAALYELKRRVAVDELEALRRPQFLVSAFGGFATVPGEVRNPGRDGTFGLYGVRFSVVLPSRDAASSTRLAEARLELEEAERLRARAAETTRERVSLLGLSMDATKKRIELLERSVAIAKQRQRSITRLVVAGARAESELVEAVKEVAKRESDLLAVRVERWKLAQLARRLETQKKTQTILRAGTSP